MNTFFDFAIDGSYGLEWAKKFLELDEDPWLTDLKIKGEHCYIDANNNCFYLLIHEKKISQKLNKPAELCWVLLFLFVCFG